MTACDLLADLGASGVELLVADGQIRARAPKGTLTQDLLGELRTHKAEIIALLAGGPPTEEIGPGDWIVVAKPAELVCPKLGKSVAVVNPHDCGRALCVRKRVCKGAVTRPGSFVGDGAVVVESVRRPRQSEAWAVVSTGKAYPLAWLQRVEPNADGGAA